MNDDTLNDVSVVLHINAVLLDWALLDRICEAKLTMQGTLVKELCASSPRYIARLQGKMWQSASYSKLSDFLQENSAIVTYAHIQREGAGDITTLPVSDVTALIETVKTFSVRQGNFLLEWGKVPDDPDALPGPKSNEELRPLLNMRMEDVISAMQATGHVKARLKKAAEHDNICHVGMAVQKTEAEWLREPGLGRESLRKLIEALAMYQLTLGMDMGWWREPENLN